MKTSHGLAIDGFMGSGTTGSNQPLKKSYKINDASNLLNPKAAGLKLKSAAQGVHQRAQRSQTLMRTAVQRPVNKISNQKKASSPVIKTVQTNTRSVNEDSGRVFRARSIIKNSRVQRFGHVEAPKTYSVVRTPVIQKAAPKAAATTAPNNFATYRPLPSMLSSTSNRQLERMLDNALLNADAHKKALTGRLNPNLWQKIKLAPRWLTVGISIFAVVLLTGFLAIQKVPNVAMRIAATKAHVAAQLPSYTPSGFSLVTPIHSSPGSVVVRFAQNGNSSRSYTLTQSASQMDNQSLSASVVPHNTQVQTSSVNGTTVYIYGNDNNAVWVDHGMQYKISDSANLNSDQLLKIASSL